MSMCTRTLINKYLNSFWKSIANHFWQQTFILKLFVSKYKLLFFKDFLLTAQIPCDISTNAICVLGERWLPRQSAWSFPQSLKKISYTEKTAFGNNPAFLAHTTRNAGLLFWGYELTFKPSLLRLFVLILQYIWSCLLHCLL